MSDEESAQDLAQIFAESDSDDSDFAGFDSPDEEAALRRSAVVNTIEFTQVCKLSCD